MVFHTNNFLKTKRRNGESLLTQLKNPLFCLLANTKVKEDKFVYKNL